MLAGETVRHEAHHPISGGADTYSNVVVTPLAEDGRVIGFVHTVADATERKRTEKQLRDSQERFELAVRGADDGLWDWEVAQGTLYFSPRWKAVLGYADDEVDNRFEEWDTVKHARASHVQLRNESQPGQDTSVNVRLGAG